MFVQFFIQRPPGSPFRSVLTVLPFAQIKSWLPLVSFVYQTPYLTRTNEKHIVLFLVSEHLNKHLVLLYSRPRNDVRGEHSTPEERNNILSGSASSFFLFRERVVIDFFDYIFFCLLSKDLWTIFLREYIWDTDYTTKMHIFLLVFISLDSGMSLGVLWSPWSSTFNIRKY